MNQFNTLKKVNKGRRENSTIIRGRLVLFWLGVGRVGTFKNNRFRVYVGFAPSYHNAFVCKRGRQDTNKD